MVHAAIAIGIQAVIGFPTRNWWLGAAVAISFFAGREITQAEYRWIAAFGSGQRANMPWWGGLDPAAWTTKSVFDLALPVLATILVAVAIRQWTKK